MSAPREILDLIARFEQQLDAYKSGPYNETQLRREFLDPFFKALGWDIDNEQGYAEAYKDVIHEDAIRMGSATKAPDYCFRIGGARKFFLEAKKPSVDIKQDISPAHQLRSYGWSAKLPLSILGDFEELAVYDYPVVLEHLRPFKQRLQSRATKQTWYELQQPQLNFAKFMAEPKIIFPDIAITPRFALDKVGYYGTNTTYFVAKNDLYLLGLLNSKLANFYFLKTCAGLEGKTETYLRFFGQYLEGFPVRTINFADKSDKAAHDRMVKLVEQMLELHPKLAGARTPQEKTALERQIAATDSQIDALVYELYGLTAEEIKIVEGTK